MEKGPWGANAAARSRNALILSGAGLLCFVNAAATIFLTSDGRTLATIWPANAVILALMLVRPRAAWPAILAVGFGAILLANIVTRHSLGGPFGYAIANVVELLAAALLMNRRRSGGGVLRTSRAAWPFLVNCGLLAPGASAAFAATIAWRCYGLDFTASYTTWLLSHGLGLLLFTPVFSSIVRGDYARAIRATDVRLGLSALGLLVLTAGLSLLIFRYATMPVLFLTLVPVMLVTFRIGRVGAELAVLIVALVAAVCTLHGFGPVAVLVPGAQHQVHFLQLYLVTLLLTAIPVSAELSARRALTAKLAQSEKAVKLLAANSADALLAFDAEGVCRNAAGAAERLLARPAGALIGMPASALAAQCGVDDLAIAMAAARNDPGMTAICEFRSAATPHLWLEASITSADDADGAAGLVATIRDVTERKEREAALSRLARTDGLTGALNRAGFLETLDEFAAADIGRPYALAAIDIDHFKRINDRLGHHAGDAALQQLARLLASGLRRGDAVGRIGGDEFMIALRATDLDTASAICGRLTETVHGTILTLPDGGATRLTISCGIAAHEPGTTSEATRQAADEALYAAKRAGRNRISVAA